MDLLGNDQDRFLIYVSMMQAALRMRDIKRNKEFFLVFAGEVWDSMEAHNQEDLEKTLLYWMEKHLESMRSKRADTALPERHD
jgi:hypothetical protein